MPDEHTQLKNLKALISKSKKKMPKIQEFWHYFGVDSNDEVLFKILDLVEYDIDNLNLNSDYKEFQYLSNCFKYFNYSKSRAKFDNEDIHYEVYLRLKKISEKIDDKLENKGRIANYNKFTKVQSQLVSFMNNTESYRKKWASDITISPEEHNEVIKKLAEHVLFEVKDIQISKNLIKDIREVKEIRYVGNKTILAKIFASYVKGLKDSNDYDVVYYQELIRDYFNKGLSKEELRDVKEHAVQLSAFIQYSKHKSLFVIKYAKSHLEAIEDYLKNNRKVINLRKPTSPPVYDKLISYKELKALKYDVSKYEDMRDKYTFTIDSESCKRKEDAISISKYGDSGFELNVFISDIAELINNDKELYDRVISMIVSEEKKYKILFSKQFLEEHISLDEGKDRFTIAFTFKFDNNLDMIDFDVKHALIHIDKNYFDDNIVEELQKEDINDQMHVKMLINFVAARLYKKESSNNEVCFCKKMLSDKLKKYPSTGVGVISETVELVNSEVSNFFKENDLPLIYKQGYYEEPKKVIKYLNELKLTKKEMQVLKEDLCKKTYNENLTVSIDDELEFKNGLHSSVTNPIRDHVSFLNQVLIKDFVLDDEIDYGNLMTSEKLHQLKKKHSATIPYICHFLDQKRKIARAKRKI